MLSDIVSTAVSPLSGIAQGLGLDNNSQIDSAKSTLNEILDRANAVSAQNRGIYDNYYRQMQGMYGEGASAYSDAVKNLADAIGNYKDFEYTGKVEDYLDPARNQRVAAATNAIENAASAGGSRFSSGYLDKLAAKQQALASEEWKSAYDRLISDRNQQLQQWQTGQTKINNLGTLAGIYGNDRNNLMQALSEYTSNMANQNNADLQMATDVMGQKVNLDMNRKGGISAIIDGLAPVAGAVAPIFGGK